jgi:hypothetical protein
MLDHDGADQGNRFIDRYWLAGCENPPADLYQGCFTQFAGLRFSELGGPNSKIKVGQGPEFSFSLRDDIISARPVQPDPTQLPFGVSYVFFAACAGTLKAAPSRELETFPLACYSDEGDRLGADDFIIGYTSVFAYESVRNRNPVITGFEIQGLAADQSLQCIGRDCIDLTAPVARDAGAPDGNVPEGGADAGVPPDAGTDGGSGAGDAGAAEGGAPTAPTDEFPDENCDLSTPNCIAVCKRDPIEDCPDIKIQVRADRASAEVDEVIALAEGNDLLEQMWVNYYVDRGEVESDVKLLNDAVEGWSDDPSTNLHAPKEPGRMRIWAVARDSRGGAEWIKVNLMVRR